LILITAISEKNLTRYGLSVFALFELVQAIQRGEFAHARCLPRSLLRRGRNR